MGQAQPAVEPLDVSASSYTTGSAARPAIVYLLEGLISSLNVIHDMGFTNMTPVQAGTIPRAVKNQDCVVEVSLAAPSSDRAGFKGPKR